MESPKFVLKSTKTQLFSMVLRFSPKIDDAATQQSDNPRPEIFSPKSLDIVDGTAIIPLASIGVARICRVAC